MPVDELAAIVRVEPTPDKRQLLGDRGQCLEDAVLAFAHDCWPLDPARMNVHGAYRMQELPRPRCARMRDQINLQIAGRVVP